MFEVTGTDIVNLNDSDLRTLVARLALAELRKQGAPLSAVTAGGNQDAADGGLDVRVDCPVPLADSDFVPRAQTGFQVKKPDMPAAAIKDEMRPDDILRPVITDLANASGAYVIVSAQGSVADKPLADRKATIRSALHDCPTASQLKTDFYDRERLATWANEYPGIAAWVRSRVGLGLSGWGSVGNWTGTQVGEATPYLFNDKACLVDERSREREPLTIAEGIARLRAALRTPKQCIRLIGLSGLGKTRFVQALFENGVGDDPLDPGLAIYTDYSTETEPSARDMARQLILRGQRAILIVDNCNPTTHGELARICSDGSSAISLITVEYDVRDDEPERTEVFRLQSAAPALVAEWLESLFPHVSKVDRERIAEFSDGNFRVARAVAETLERGETLGKLKSRELFERIFHQRHEKDQSLLAAAEDLALLYSIDGEDASAGGELAAVASVRQVAPHTLFAALVELGRRGVAQTRGRWRAILPHAIANPLATFALERIPAADFDRFAAQLPDRMRKSLSRRIGYLHDVKAAQSAVTRWLRADGPLGDLIALGDTGIQIVTNLAPVAPDAVLSRLELTLDGDGGLDIVATTATNRPAWIRLLKALAYDPALFERSAMLLARFIAAEPADFNNSSARAPFGELFQLYLSGTRAEPEQRRAVVRRLATSKDEGLRRAGTIALDLLLTARQFNATSDFDFGARSRDWGWQPKINRDTWDWYEKAIELAVSLAPQLDEARQVLANSVQDLWHYGACYDALDRAATTLVKEKPWIAGWIAFRVAFRFSNPEMPADIKAKLEAIIQRLKPSDLLHQARAVVLSRTSGGWDVADCETDDEDGIKSWTRAAQLAVDIGRSLAQDAKTRSEFLGELLNEKSPHRAYECGRGLAAGADDLSSMWQELTDRFREIDPKQRNATTLGGFIYEANQRNASFTADALERTIDDPDLAQDLPYLQARVAIDHDGIARLRRAIGRGKLVAWSFMHIASGVVGEAPPEDLGPLLVDIAALTDGVEIALDILHMYFYRDREEGRVRHPLLIDVGRNLLVRADFSKKGMLRDFGLRTCIRVCCAGTDGGSTARTVCEHIRSAMETVYLSIQDLSYVLKGLFETQPLVALDVFLLPGTAKKMRVFEMGYGMGSPIEDMDPTILRQWADRNGVRRYPLLGRSLPMFNRTRDDEDNEFSPLFLEVLSHAPSKKEFLGDFWMRLHPHSWSGSLADILYKRKRQLLTLHEFADADVRAWVEEMLPEIDRWIESERNRERGGEESFE